MFSSSPENLHHQAMEKLNEFSDLSSKDKNTIVSFFLESHRQYFVETVIDTIQDASQAKDPYPILQQLSMTISEFNSRQNQLQKLPLQWQR